MITTSYRARPQVFCQAMLLALVLSSTGCELVGPNSDDEQAPETVAGVLVANQGNFSDANGSVTVYDPTSGSVQQLEVEFGSILQSLTVVDGRVYATANSANRVDVIDLATGRRTGQISGVVSPRYLMPVDSSKAYVTSLFRSDYTGGTVSALDLRTGSVLETVDVGDHPEGLAVRGSRLYVAEHGYGSGSTVSVLDIGSDEVVDQFDVACDGPRSLFFDRQGELWVFCTGNVLYDGSYNEIGRTNGAVLVVDQAGGEMGRFDLADQIATVGPGQDAGYADAAEVAYAVSGGRILVFDTHANELTRTFVPAGEDPIGAVAYDPASHRWFVGRVPGFTAAGTVTIHDEEGSEVGRFAAGVAPTYIAFVR